MGGHYAEGQVVRVPNEARNQPVIHHAPCQENILEKKIFSSQYNITFLAPLDCASRDQNPNSSNVRQRHHFSLNFHMAQFLSKNFSC